MFSYNDLKEIFKYLLDAPILTGEIIYKGAKDMKNDFRQYKSGLEAKTSNSKITKTKKFKKNFSN